MFVVSEALNCVVMWLPLASAQTPNEFSCCCFISALQDHANPFCNFVVFPLIKQPTSFNMSDNGKSPTDIITYIGVPLAVLGGTCLHSQIEASD
jgi:hypothetical protein